MSTATEHHRIWKDHKRGDEYVVLIASIVGNETAGFHTEWHADKARAQSLSAAIHRGFSEHDRSDDFNVGVMRDGSLLAVLWMNEVVDDDPFVLAKVAERAGLPFSHPPVAGTAPP